MRLARATDSGPARPPSPDPVSSYMLAHFNTSFMCPKLLNLRTPNLRALNHRMEWDVRTPRSGTGATREEKERDSEGERERKRERENEREEQFIPRPSSLFILSTNHWPAYKEAIWLL
ncbi:hypothetical protein J6590_062708 [Homalodisca vitripennis]|nr:hypothetical protein J6590_062708 [Homalodisca vitripennis]